MKPYSWSSRQHTFEIRPKIHYLVTQTRKIERCAYQLISCTERMLMSSTMESCFSCFGDDYDSWKEEKIIYLQDRLVTTSGRKETGVKHYPNKYSKLKRFFSDIIRFVTLKIFKNSALFKEVLRSFEIQIFQNIDLAYYMYN